MQISGEFFHHHAKRMLYFHLQLMSKKIFNFCNLSYYQPFKRTNAEDGYNKKVITAIPKCPISSKQYGFIPAEQNPHFNVPLSFDNNE